MQPQTGWAIKRPGTLIPVFFLSFCCVLSAQYTPLGTESAGLGGCYTMLQGLSAVAGNQAGLGWPDPGKLSAEFGMPFNVKELGAAAITASFPLFNGHIAGNLTSYGIRGYRSNALWISYGMRIGEKISAGTGLYYNLVSTRKEIDHLFIASFAGGIQIRINDQIFIGGHLLFPYQYNSSGLPYSRLASQISLGGKYRFFGENSLHLELHFSDTAKPALAAGIESEIGKAVCLRGGLLTNPATFSLGSGFRFLNFEIMFASQLIFSYGTSSYFGILYAF